MHLIIFDNPNPWWDFSPALILFDDHYPWLDFRTAAGRHELDNMWTVSSKIAGKNFPMTTNKQHLKSIVNGQTYKNV